MFRLRGPSAGYNVFLAPQADASPFQLHDVLASDVKRVFIAGQNLHRIANIEHVRDDLTTFLKRPGRGKIELLICDPRFHAGTKTWSRVNPPRPDDDYSYEAHLGRSVRAIADLARKFPKSRLEVRLTDFVPFGAVFVDPEDKKNRGLMVLTPVVHDSYRSVDRPHFIIKRSENKDAFRYYWVRFRTIFEETGLSKPFPFKPKVFISHGHSTVWKTVARLVRGLGLTPEEFNRLPAASKMIPAHLVKLVEGSSFAVIVMTAEDGMTRGGRQARMNVVHEIGLAQAAYGLGKVVLLVEKGCKGFSNTQGLVEIRFHRRKLDSDVMRQLRDVIRENLLCPRPG